MKSLSLSKPHLVIVTGIPGSGKTFFAEQFAKTFNAPLISYDVLQTIVLADQPESITSDRLTTYRLVLNELEQLLKTKSTIVIDGASETRTERQELSKKAHTNGYKVLTVWVQTDLPTSRHRTVNSAKRHGGRPQIISLEQYEKALKRFTPPSHAEKFIVISGRHTYATQAKVLLKKLTESRDENPETLRMPERLEKRSHHILIR